jgi:predicted 3-demethylubiquinone-9 3-methyltransferase (glyoxalase superfamily)
MPRITPFLWFDGNAEEAMRFYVSVFPDSKVLSASPMMVSFELEGQRFYGLNGGPQYKFTEAVSFLVDCETQEEVDGYWSKLTAGGGQPGQCGWLKDRFGLSWQIIPKALGRLLGDPDRGKAGRVMQAMLTMGKIDLAALQRAYDQG